LLSIGSVLSGFKIQSFIRESETLFGIVVKVLPWAGRCVHLGIWPWSGVGFAIGKLKGDSAVRVGSNADEFVNRGLVDVQTAIEVEDMSDFAVSLTFLPEALD
jgi:hypothetical protein